MARGVQRAVGVLFIALVGVAPRAAHAHSSAPDALTLDLLLDQSGLVVVDAATNRASSAETPTPEERAQIARRVGDVLGITPDEVQVDDASSTLYHEVGFRMSLHVPFTNVLPAGAVRVDTAPLQAIAGELGRLVLDVCAVARPGATVAVVATTPAVAPDRSGAGAQGIDRADCRTWTLGVDDPPVEITARAKVPAPAVPKARDRVTLPCGSPSERGDPTFVVDGVVSHQPGVFQAHATGPRVSHLLTTDAVFGFRAGTRIEVVVPSSHVGHVTIGAREGARAARRLVVEKCSIGPFAAWNLSVLRIWVDEAGCLPLVIEAARARTIRLPVGAPCEGPAP
jgi:hypothetical protein